jgi:hypothetical protein
LPEPSCPHCPSIAGKKKSANSAALKGVNTRETVEMDRLEMHPAQHVKKQDDQKNRAKADTHASAISPAPVAVVSAAAAKDKDQQNDQQQHNSLSSQLAIWKHTYRQLLSGNFLDLADLFLHLARQFFILALRFQFRLAQRFSAPFAS